MVTETPHLAGTAPDGVRTFADWRDPAFLAVCARARRAGHLNAIRIAADFPERWLLVAVNGCFDSLHIGHVNLLLQAQGVAGPGDTVFLVALLNSDASVRRLKGPRRPLVPLAARLHMVSSVWGVQAAAGFDDDTPAAALAAVRPDVLVKGADYEQSRIPGVEHCGRVVFVPLTPGVSTTAFVKTVSAAGSSG